MFKPEDFKHGYPEGPDSEDLADFANEKIQPLLEELVRLQDLCREQEQHGMDFANEVAKQLLKAEDTIRFIRSCNAWPDLSEHKYVTSGKMINDAIIDYFYEKENK